MKQQPFILTLKNFKYPGNIFSFDIFTSWFIFDLLFQWLKETRFENLALIRKKATYKWTECHSYTGTWCKLLKIINNLKMIKK